MIAKALACAEHTGEVYAIADLHRIKGELLMKSVRTRPFCERRTSIQRPCLRHGRVLLTPSQSRSSRERDRGS